MHRLSVQRAKRKRTDRKLPPQVPWPQPGPRGQVACIVPDAGWEPIIAQFTPCLYDDIASPYRLAPLAQALRLRAACFPLIAMATGRKRWTMPPHEPYDITPGCRPHATGNKAGKADAPTLVLTDVLGATPSNIAQRLVEGQAQQRLLSGVNLPMLLRALCYRHEDLEALPQRALDGGHAGIVQVPHQAVELSSAVATRLNRTPPS